MTTTPKKPDFSNVRSGASSSAAPPAKPVEAPGEAVTYTVVKGDTLSKIAQRQYGSAGAWTKIFEANRDILKDPDKIFPGQTLKLPPKAK